MSKNKSVYMNEETALRFKQYCRDNGMMMGFVINKIVNEWLDKKEKEQD
jgi:hypothetical protein